ncbi:MAG: PAS domain S-box protein [Candidatus Muiribacteriota bacterium]
MKSSILDSIFFDEAQKGDKLAFFLRHVIFGFIIILAWFDTIFSTGRTPELIFILSVALFTGFFSVIIKKMGFTRSYFGHFLLFSDLTLIGVHNYLSSKNISSTAHTTSASIFLFFVYTLLASLGYRKRLVVFSGLYSLFIFNFVYIIRYSHIENTLLKEIVSSDITGQIYKSFYFVIFTSILFFFLKITDNLIEKQAVTVEAEEKARKNLDIEKKHKKLLEDRLALFVKNLKGEYFFFSHTPEGEILYSSPSIKNVLGYTPEEFKGNVSQYFTNNPVNNKVKSFFKTNYKKKSSEPYEIEHITKDGGVRTLHILEIPIKNEKGKIISIEGIAHDITLKKKYEDALKKSELKMKEYAKRITQIREEEKKILSANLHDELGTMAITIGANLNLINEEIKENNKSEAKKLVVKTQNILKDSISKLKNIAKELRPPNMDMLGIAASLQLYFEKVENDHNLRINFSTNIESSKIPEEISISIYRITQEAITNIIKYSRAKFVNIKLKKFKNRLEYIIKDDGRGFDIKALANDTENKKLGITGMQERVNALMGKFRIQSQPERGTEIIIEIPLSEE